MCNTYRSVSELCAEFLIDRDERKAEMVKTHALLRQVGTRLASVEVRLAARAPRRALCLGST